MDLRKSIASHRLSLGLVSFLLTLVVSYIIILFGLKTPFFWIGIAFLALLLIWLTWATSTASRMVLIHVMAVVLTATGFELYLWEPWAPEPYGTKVQKADEQRHPKLGYMRVSQGISSHLTYESGSVTRKIENTASVTGFQIPFLGDVSRCALFFGGSFAEGIGVASMDSMPYQVGVKRGGSVRTYNLGIGGWGAHQMLSLIENGIVQESIECSDVKWIIYFGIVDHIKRAAGRAFWDQWGPKYRLDNNGEAVRAGTFRDPPLRKKFWRLFNRSYLFQEAFGYRRRISKSEIELYAAIVVAARKQFAETFPNVEFHVLYWDIPLNRDATDVLEALRAQGISYHLVSAMLGTTSSKDVEKYLLKYDGHPNELGHATIAEYVARDIVVE